MVRSCPSCECCPNCDRENLPIYHVADGVLVSFELFDYDYILCEVCLREKGLLW